MTPETTFALSLRTASPPERRAALRHEYIVCRQGTLALFAGVDDACFRRQVHPEFSPLGWHLGHAAYTEALWLVAKHGGSPLPRPELERIFAVDGLKKSERVNIPPIGEVLDYAQAVRKAVLECLEAAPLDEQERLWWFVLQHECQHTETVTFLKKLIALDGLSSVPRSIIELDLGIGADCRPRSPENDLVPVPRGPVVIGNDGLDAMDNERPAHQVFVDDFRIGATPVTQADYRAFMEAGGYQDPRHWSAEGWAWREAENILMPLYWEKATGEGPVCGVSCHEAEAYCNFAGSRLPTEAEWEKAAAWNPDLQRGFGYPWGEEPPHSVLVNCNNWDGGTSPLGSRPAGRSAYGAEDMLGNVWEWTATPFGPYPGFAAFPYEGYSQAYFDGEHRVMRGGSWATRPWALRTSFRNWYTPETRQVLAGFRRAKDGLED